MTDGDPTDRRYTYAALQSDGLPFSKNYVDATACRQNNAIPDSATPTTVFLGQNNVQVLSGSEFIILFSCSTQLSMNFFLLVMLKCQQLLAF